MLRLFVMNGQWEWVTTSVPIHAIEFSGSPSARFYHFELDGETWWCCPALRDSLSPVKLAAYLRREQDQDAMMPVKWTVSTMGSVSGKTQMKGWFLKGWTRFANLRFFAKTGKEHGKTAEKLLGVLPLLSDTHFLQKSACCPQYKKHHQRIFPNMSQKRVLLFVGRK